MAINSERKADAAERKADAARAFVIMTRNKIEEELRDLRMPWWKKLFGTAAQPIQLFGFSIAHNGLAPATGAVFTLP